MKEYDLFIPLYYNDGRPIEPQKFQDLQQLLDQFGDLTLDYWQSLQQSDPSTFVTAPFCWSASHSLSSLSLILLPVRLNPKTLAVSLISESTPMPTA